MTPVENQQVASAATPAVAAADATITIAVEAENATGKIDRVHNTLSRNGDTARHSGLAWDRRAYP